MTRLVLRIALVSLVLAAVLLTLLQRNLLYYPDHASEAALRERANQWGLRPWESGGKRIGWRSDGGDPSHAFLVFHGNAGNAADRGYFLEPLRTAFPGASVFILEYPGYGQREGRPSEKAFVRSGTDALRALAKERPESNLFLVGESIGTGVATQVAAQQVELLSGLLLITPFDSMVNVAAIHYPWLPTHLLLRDRFDSTRALRDIRLPVFLLVAGRDGVIPPRLAEQLSEAYPGPKRSHLIEGAGHNDIIGKARAPVWKEIGTWLRETPRGAAPGN